GGTAAFGNSSGLGGGDVVGNINIGAGQTVTQDLGFKGMMPVFISLRMFCTSTTAADFPFAAAGGSGTAIANFRANNAPTLKNAIADVSVARNAPNTVIDLAGNFTDSDFTNSLIRFKTSAGDINAQLFDTTAPQTVA